MMCLLCCCCPWNFISQNMVDFFFMCRAGLMRAFRVEDLPIESKMLTKALDEAQRKVENYFFDIRKQLFEFDEVLNSQRDRVYTERRRALESDNLQSLLIEYAELTMDDILEVSLI